MGLWRYISDIGTRSTDETDQVKRIQLINQLSFIATAASVIFVPFLYFLGSFYYSYVLMVISLLTACYVLFMFYRMINTALVWTLTITLISVLWGSLENPTAGVEFLYIPLSLVPFTVVSRIKACYAFVLLSILCFSASYFLKKIYVPHYPLPPLHTEIIYFGISGTAFVLSALIIGQFRLVNSKYEQIIRSQKREVEAKNKDIIDSIKYAKRIQETLLPQEKYIEKALKRLLQGSDKSS